ncbi:ribonuclease P protein component [Chroococcidiopsis sp. FACHB-1243]|uniref:ribonuclease P protein component n=1 Tax=Chroococcidiopsis sp. [FACHB-1243] TaxID=2692781 RepID=UPI00178475C1|nr:ribonuclease P protein component [Chroococcidiopsis sp. [FACHB-1243]]
MGLSKVNRLSSREDFRAVFRAGIRRNSDRMTLRALRMQNATTSVADGKLATATHKVGAPTRIGISISTKVSKKAVVRNRIKRQLRVAFRCLLPRISPGWLLVVIVQPSAARQECVTKQFLQELEQLLVAAEVLNGNS